ncbi:RpiR family transcriptional regulator [Paenibacillus sp. FSL R7-0273]|uniref:MurR/RpiR family transcriptional regulator n=1 Tax=Paenibacillus sp. FSL R7-0273 TaxID=1536772 RepID=UPI0004F76FE9|nr:MurR/RpiR family transcriptional regulator [Paenibacillus sp. FSL R7-0273]AIQ47412.1 RpiR family transcriptional regulator [Paenibacillus sp. FSL R7-0273]OMF96034.1 RpiR family transcriptional regulator [Paenibacillus sp. FSL R7-0273]
MFSNEQISSFNDLELSIYNYISQNLEKVAYMRIRELADETHVSTATILRFCRKNQCEGFSEFKVKIKLHLTQNKKLVLKSPHHSIYEFFERSQSPEWQNKIQKATQLLSKASYVIFIGVGSSGILAEYGARYFSSLGIFSMYIKDPEFRVHARVRENSITIALSASGENPFTISHLKQIKEGKSKIISITNNRQSTIAKISDINIPYYVTEEIYETSNITTQVPVLFLLEWLAREVYKQNETS